MKLVVGLGNPGNGYIKTRHNIGFNILDMICDKYNLSFNLNKKFNALDTTINVNGEKVILVKPLSYMNLSGDVVCLYVNYYNIDLNDILIIHDDLDMVLGKIRLVYDSSSGGHNGIKSIIGRLGSQKFLRLKIGISNDKSVDTKDYVLGKFNKEEDEILNSTYTKLSNLLEDFTIYDINILKQIYNSKNN